MDSAAVIIGYHKFGMPDRESTGLYMSFIFMVFHWPEPGRADALAQSMQEMGGLLAGTPGCTAVEPPYFTDDGTCLVGISKWESKQAFLASGITLRPPDEVVEGETRPRQRFFLEPATAA